jgi:hypothetical protein
MGLAVRFAASWVFRLRVITLRWAFRLIGLTFDIAYWRRTSRIGNNHHGRRVGVFARIGENSEVFVFKKLNFQRRHLQDLDHHPPKRDHGD